MTEKSFLDAIIAQPDDEALRLVFADWLEENADEEGRDRATLIRLQIQSDKLKPRSRPRQRLEREARTLLKKYDATWVQPIREEYQVWDLVFRAGYLYQVTTGATRFIERAKKLLAAVPTLRSVVFHHAANEVRDLAGCEQLLYLHQVDLSFMCTCGNCRINDEIREFVVSPYVANLRRLILQGNRVNSLTITQLVGSAHLGNLRHLNLSQNRIGSTGARRLISSPLADRLEYLDLLSNDLPPQVITQLQARYGNRVVV